MNVLVIGNGFDMDLGLRTSFYSFWKSEVFQKHLLSFTTIPNTLANYLSKKANKDSFWFNIEEAMVDYVKLKEIEGDSSVINVDMDFLNTLKYYFWDYVCSEYLDSDNRKCLSKSIIKIQKQFNKIYSFNCFETFYNDFVSMGNIAKIDNVLCIHNYAEQFILGIGDNDCVNERYAFLKKTHQNYPFNIVNNFKDDLIKAKNIVIFGHSINRIDMVYFRDMIRDTNSSQRKSKRIAFVTKDKHAATQIQNNITNYGPLPFEVFKTSCKLSFALTETFNDSTIIENVNDIFKISF